MLGSEPSNYLGFAEIWWVTMSVEGVGEWDFYHLGLCVNGPVMSMARSGLSDVKQTVNH